MTTDSNRSIGWESMNNPTSIHIRMRELMVCMMIMRVVILIICMTVVISGRNPTDRDAHAHMYMIRITLIVHALFMITFSDVIFIIYVTFKINTM